MGSDRIEARPGIGIPPTTWSEELRCPKSVSGTSLLVCGTISIEANFPGCSLKTQRASASPTPICTGVAIAATENAIRNASRW